MAKVTSKLQLTIPKAVADRAGIRPGDDLEVQLVGRSLWLSPQRRNVPQLTLEEKLRLFDEDTARIAERAAELQAPRATAPDWNREELYDLWRFDDDRPRRY